VWEGWFTMREYHTELNWIHEHQMNTLNGFIVTCIKFL